MHNFNNLFKIVFLGTGALIPSLKRGAPAVALCYDHGIILFDCGEGTQMRLAQAGLSPFKVHTIFISHLHGDHIFGLPGFVTSQHMMNRSRLLTIYGPPGLQQFMNGVRNVTRYALNFPMEMIELIPRPVSEIKCDIFKVIVQPLVHNSPCLGYRVEEPPKPGKFDAQKAKELRIPEGPERRELINGRPVYIGKRIINPDQVVGEPVPGRIVAYCTDTRPCQQAELLSKASDLLIHESTFSDEFKDRAVDTSHSTAREAATVALHAETALLALFHSSMRLQHENSTDLLHEARTIFPNTVLPKDFDELDINRREA